MARQKKKPANLAFDAITVEGSLIAPAVLARIAARDAGDQTEAAYGIPKGLTIRDEIARYFRMGQALFASVSTPTASTAATIRFTEELLRDVFGFKDIARAGPKTLDGRTYVVTLEAGSGRVPVVVVPPADELDKVSDHLLKDGRRRSASSALQDWLNAQDDALWGLCCNGHVLRLARDNASLTRPAMIEADLKQIFENESFADFTVLWLLIHASRFGAAGLPAADCALERWRDAGAREGLAARDRLRDGVEAALLSLGKGFLQANPPLREKIYQGTLPLPDYFVELLRTIYRLIFLMVAEERGVLHGPDTTLSGRKLYADGYSLARLREHAVRRAAWDGHTDRWEGLRVVFRALATGEKRLGLPALGGLFSPEFTPNVDTAALPNRALMEAILRLAWLREENALVPVNWRDMETEELGSVYESLLELTPRIFDEGRDFGFAEGAETKGNARKTSGSYYTPDSLVQALLDTALDPVMDRAEAEAEDRAAGLLALRVIDPACGSGHFLLAAARRIAARVARARSGGVASAADYRHALRDVVRHCIHGTDRNPMAVELSKVALWIETVEPGKPLGFLDASIRCGDSLLGILDLEALRHGIPDQAYAALSGDDAATARYYQRRNRDERQGQGTLDLRRGGGKLPPPPPLGTVAGDLRALPEDTPAEIEEKRRRFASARKDPRLWVWRQAADLYVAAFLLPKTGGPPANPNTPDVPTTAHVWGLLQGQSVYGPLIGKAQDRASEALALHWPLEFPDVIGAGGFDLVIGNPPWERIKLQEQEFFASRDSEIAAAPNAAARGRMIAALKAAAIGSRARALYNNFEVAKRTAEASSTFSRIPLEERGRFPLTGRGDVNTYALFAELLSQLSGTRGRAGMIVPTGIATDATTSTFFSTLVVQNRLVSLIDYENRQRIFPSVDSRMKFSLLTIGRDVEEAQFSFFLTDTAQAKNPERQFNLRSDEIASINPNTGTAPIFRSKHDAKLASAVYSRIPVLFDENDLLGNRWGIKFDRMFDMSNDSHQFRTAVQLSASGFEKVGPNWEGTANINHTKEQNDQISILLDTKEIHSDVYVPLYEAKMFNLYDHRFASYGERGDERGYRVLPETSESEHANPNFDPIPFYWIPQESENSWTPDWSYRWYLAFKDVTSVTNERTVICAILPRTGIGNTAPIVISNKPPHLVACLYANLNSLILDYFARSKVGGLHLNYVYLKQFPIIPPDFYDENALRFLVPRIIELTYTSHSMKYFALDLGIDAQPFEWNEYRRAIIRAEIDAFFAIYYGLTRDDLRFILDPRDVRGDDYPSETFRTLKAREIADYGEYRTAKLVLQAFDRLEAGQLAAE